MMCPSKVCKGCGSNKPLSEFYINRRMKDGRLNHCKECKRDDSSRQRWKNIEREREKDRKRGSRQTYEYQRQWRSLFPEKAAAHRAIKNALRSGKIKKPNECERCGSSDRVIHGHHDDYSRPLDVMWLCPVCHKLRHEELDGIENPYRAEAESE